MPAGLFERDNVAGTYRIVLRGVPPGRSVAATARMLARRFEIPADKWSMALREPRFVIKRGLGLVEAARYNKALRDAGCRILVEAEEVAAGKPTPPPGAATLAAARRPFARGAGKGLRGFAGSRLRRCRTSWTSMPARQKVIAAALGLGGLVIVTAAVLLSILGADRGATRTRTATAAQAASAAAAILPTIVGTWTCRAESASGFGIRDTYVFGSDGTFEDRGREVQFEGVYEVRERAIVMTVQRARMGTTTVVPGLVFDATVTMLGDREIRLETTARGSTEKKTSNCSRAAA